MRWDETRPSWMNRKHILRLNSSALFGGSGGRMRLLPPYRRPLCPACCPACLPRLFAPPGATGATCRNLCEAVLAPRFRIPDHFRSLGPVRH